MQQHRFSALCTPTGLTSSLGIAFLCLTLLLAPAVAQREKEKPDPLQVSPQEQQQKPLQEDQRRHVGTAAEAVVHVRVRLKDPATGKMHVREGSGFVARCDGFILVPTALFSRKSGKGRGESLEFAAPHPNTLTFVPPLQGKTPPPQTVPRLHFFQEKRGFVMAKVNGWHLPCLPMLAPRNIREGMPVRIVYAVPADEKPQTEAKTATADAVVGAPLGKDGRRFALSFPGSGKALPPVPPGAVVVDRASGLAVGIVPGTATGGSDSDTEQPAAPAVLLSFTDLYQASNAAALLPDASAAISREADAPQPGTEKDNMVWIPGGTADMSALTETPRRDYDYTLLYNNRRVCMPGFWIDKHPVTNAQYQNFLAKTNYPRLPRDWAPAERGTLSGREPEVPVTGVTTEDAMAYAAWSGKRLVTPSEWVRACGGGFHDTWNAWWGAYAPARLTAYLALQLKYVQAPPLRAAREQEYRRQSQGWRPSPANSVSPKGSDRLPKGQMAAAIQAEIQPVQRHFGYPRILIPVGQRDFDVSVFGVRDVKLNGNELLLPNTTLSAAERAAKYTNCIDPDHLPRWNEYDLLDAARVIFSKGALVGPDGQRILSGGVDRSQRFPVQQWQVDLDMPIDGNRIEIRAGEGFRCAR